MSLSPGGLTLAARRHELPVLSALTLSPGGLHITARRHDSNYTMAILNMFKHHLDCPTILPLFQGITNCNFSTYNVFLHHSITNVNSLSNYNHTDNTKHSHSLCLDRISNYPNHDSIVTKFPYVIILVL